MGRAEGISAPPHAPEWVLIGAGLLVPAPLSVEEWEEIAQQATVGERAADW